MSHDVDPVLRDVFRAAREELAADAFATRVMAEIETLRRRAIGLWVFVWLAFVALAWLLFEPVTEALRLAMQVLPGSLIQIEQGWARQLLSPVNSVAAVVAALFLGIRCAVRKIFP